MSFPQNMLPISLLASWKGNSFFLPNTIDGNQNVLVVTYLDPYP